VPYTEATIDSLRERARPIEDAELALARSVLARPGWLDDAAEGALRHALALSRVGRIRTPGGTEADLWEFLAPLRDRVASSLLPQLARGDDGSRDELARLATPLGAEASRWRARALQSFSGRLPAAALDRELHEKALVLVCGGGGGVGWSYLGAFDLLERAGLVPRLCAGASMGAVLLLLRARALRWDRAWVASLVGGLGYGQLFRILQTDSRYALPAAIQLQLRESLGEHLRTADGRYATLADLPIPLVVAVTGVRTGALPRDPGFYEHLLDDRDRSLRPHALERLVARVFKAAGELARRRDRLLPIYLGADPETAAFDALDAVGFSCALPGVVHYDVLRDDPRMHALLDALFQRHGLARLLDGGLTDNLPARAAWKRVQGGELGTRNALVVGLEGFAPKLRQPLWYGLEQIAAQNVARNLAFVHVHRSFQRVLSPLDVVPGPAQLERAVQAGSAELEPDLPVIARLCRPWRPPLTSPGARPPGT
jgi:predicted acylesterase/phospholipase RssA